MALGSTLYRTRIELADADRNRYQTLETRIAQHPSETAERLVARLLAYALCHEEGLEFTRGICDGESPDLWQRDPDGRIQHWIEVGLPEPARIQKACKQAGQVSLFLFGRTRHRWETMHLNELRELSNLNLYGLDMGLIDRLVNDLARSIQWSLTRSGAILYLTTGDHCLESELEIIKES